MAPRGKALLSKAKRRTVIQVNSEGNAVKVRASTGGSAMGKYIRANVGGTTWLVKAIKSERQPEDLAALKERAKRFNAKPVIASIGPAGLIKYFSAVTGRPIKAGR